MAPLEAKPDLNKKARIDAVVTLINSRIQKSERASLITFARGYFERVDPEDLAARDVEDLYGAVLPQWHFDGVRESGTAKVRIFNPDAGEHGWTSRRTVVEVVNDDMPFLV